MSADFAIDCQDAASFDGPELDTEADVSIRTCNLMKTVLAKLNANDFVKEFTTSNQNLMLVNYLWSKDGDSVLPLDAVQRHIFTQIVQFKAIHQKNLAMALKTVKAADQSFADADFKTAIELYAKAIKFAPHKQEMSNACHLAKLYAKRSICFFLTSALQEGEFDYRICAHLDANIGRLCLEKVLHSLKNPPPAGLNVNESLIQFHVLKLQNEADASTPAAKKNFKVAFNSQMLTLWFDNTSKGKRHRDGAHYLCAKMDLPAGSKVLEEKPLVCISAANDSTCAGCNEPMTRSFWPCDTCDEVVFCSMDCHRDAVDHVLACGLASYMRANLTPLGAILFHLYIRTQCRPEYSFKMDFSHRPHLSTDSDVHFAGRQNPSKLPKRSYQYRYFLLANGKKAWASSQELAPMEALLALRESADNKDDLLPLIAQDNLISVLLEAIQLLYVMDFVTYDGSLSKPNKYRLMAILQDYHRLYRLNSAQGIQDSTVAEPLLYFTQSIMGTFFWPDCQPNVEVAFCAAKGTLQYRTIKPVKRRDKLVVAFPADYIARRDLTVDPCRCLSCAVKVADKSLNIPPMVSNGETSKTDSVSSLGIAPMKRSKEE